MLRIDSGGGAALPLESVRCLTPLVSSLPRSDALSSACSHWKSRTYTTLTHASRARAASDGVSGFSIKSMRLIEL